MRCCRIPGLKLEGPEIEIPGFTDDDYYMSDAHAIVGMKCYGDYCDYIAPILRSAVGTRGEWTEDFVEPKHGDCDNGYVAGVRCKTGYCNTLSLYCKGIVRYPSIIQLLLFDTK